MSKLNSNFGIIQKVINQEMTEKELFHDITDEQGRIIVDLPEITLSKHQPNILKEFLLSLSLEGRFRILFSKEMLGMPENTFIKKYGVNKKIIQVYKGLREISGSSKKGEIRDIIIEDRPKLEILATLFLFTRVPIEWMLKEKPCVTTSWKSYPFEILPDVLMTLDELNQYLKSTKEAAILDKTKHTRPNFPYVYDARSFILNIDSRDIYLKALIYKGGEILVEIFNDNIQPQALIKLKQLLAHYGPIILGYCETVVENQQTITMIAKSRKKIICLPIEFKEI
ncbi:hypothetical protein E3U55_15560 [Filobacillus milosensis]|uniref:Uncharacterized protein n=1 Tax=Filobacillus milosensis TaxID=94137 RepID=A0A4Y8IF21_9BACI|nr:hypothetical protein [Filobacillus milosensis]TFB13673.1 hypothetical protein E3U55_15560 [Filobacillus milosensis]